MTAGDGPRGWMPRTAAVDALDRQARIVDVPFESSHVRWRRFGDGPPVVLVHGGHGSWMHWLRNIPALARTHRVWVPDLPGFGESGGVPEDPSDFGSMHRLIDALQATMHRVLDAADAPHIVAFSFGALVTAHLHRRGVALRSIALLGPAAHGGPRGPEAVMPPWRNTHSIEDREAALRRNLLAFMLVEPAAADASALYAQEHSSLRCRFPAVREVSRASRIGELFGGFDGPLLSLWGARDCTAIPGEVGPLLAGGRAGRTWSVISDAAHWVQYEQAEAVNGVLSTWLTGDGALHRQATVERAMGIEPTS